MALPVAYQLKTLLDISTFIANEIKVQTSSVEDMNRITRAINTVYLDRVSQHSYWPWLRKTVDLPFRMRQTINATFTYDSTLVTLATGPTESVGGYLLSAQGLNQRLKIASHSPGATTLQLESPWTSPSSASALSSCAYIWSESVILPNESRQVTNVMRAGYDKPLENVGMQKYRQLVTANPASSYDPTYYAVFDYVDALPFEPIASLPVLATSASSGVIRTLTFTMIGEDTMANYVQQGQRILVQGANDYRFNIEAVVSSVSTASVTYTGRERFTQAATADSSLLMQAASVESTDERYQALFVYPNFLIQDKTLTVEYQKDIVPLVNATDEPILPLGDRVVLAYGALAQVWDSIGRNPQMAQKNEGLFQDKLSNMLSRIDAGTDYPSLVVDRLYLGRKRNPESSRWYYWD